ELRAKYFSGANHRLSFRNDIRRCVIFGRNDLMQDPPISRVDLLLSRNTLMYFNASAQERILANFYFALTRRCFLALGKAESLRHPPPRPWLAGNTAPGLEPRGGRRRAAREEGEAAPPPPIEPAFEQAPISQFVVDGSGRIAAINHYARAMFGLKSGDVGRPL